VPQVVLRGQVISSSAIRRLVGAGDVTRAARLLERPYSVEGRVVSGRKIGSTKTVPTLNLETEAEVLPADGVYITRAQDSSGGPLWPAVTNVGWRPTFDGSSLTIETHLLVPFGDADPQRIRIEFLRRVREERKFEDAASLRAQILRDVGRARRYFRLLDRLLYFKK
jgi:riboflavin kinase/FMN adenylyltransferase